MHYAHDVKEISKVLSIIFSLEFFTDVLFFAV